MYKYVESKDPLVAGLIALYSLIRSSALMPFVRSVFDNFIRVSSAVNLSPPRKDPSASTGAAENPEAGLRRVQSKGRSEAPFQRRVLKSVSEVGTWNQRRNSSKGRECLRNLAIIVGRLIRRKRVLCRQSFASLTSLVLRIECFILKLELNVKFACMLLQHRRLTLVATNTQFMILRLSSYLICFTS